jgi:hypothetical protein
MTEETTTIKISKKDRDFLDRLKKRNKKISMGAVLESLIKIIKAHKFEEEIK